MTTTTVQPTQRTRQTVVAEGLDALEQLHAIRAWSTMVGEEGRRWVIDDGTDRSARVYSTREAEAFIAGAAVATR